LEYDSIINFDNERKSAVEALNQLVSNYVKNLNSLGLKYVIA